MKNITLHIALAFLLSLVSITMSSCRKNSDSTFSSECSLGFSLGMSGGNEEGCMRLVDDKKVDESDVAVIFYDNNYNVLVRKETKDLLKSNGKYYLNLSSEEEGIINKHIETNVNMLVLANMDEKGKSDNAAVKIDAKKIMGDIEYNLEKRLIPMAGIKKIRLLNEEIGEVKMLRAVAGIRVRLKDDYSNKNYELKSVKLNIMPNKYYTLPAGLSTETVSYKGDDSVFNPYSEEEPNVEGKNFWISEGRRIAEILMPEYKNENNHCMIEVEVVNKDNPNDIYKRNLRIKNNKELTCENDIRVYRNMFYDYTMMIDHDDLISEIKISDWDKGLDTDYDYEQNFSCSCITWDTSTCDCDAENGEILLHDNVVAKGSFTITAPRGTEWYASIRANDADAVKIMFVRHDAEGNILYDEDGFMERDIQINGEVNQTKAHTIMISYLGDFVDHDSTAYLDLVVRMGQHIIPINVVDADEKNGNRRWKIIKGGNL